MRKEVTAALLDSAIATEGNVCTTCVLAQTFGIAVGFDDRDSTYHGFDLDYRKDIFQFDQKGQRIAQLFDEGKKNGDLVMAELREMLPCEVRLGE